MGCAFLRHSGSAHYGPTDPSEWTFRGDSRCRGIRDGRVPGPDRAACLATYLTRGRLSVTGARDCELAWKRN